MDYTDDFPVHLRANVDVALAQAELDYWKSNGNYPERIEDFVKTVFLVFAQQVCEATREGVWDGARSRRGLTEFLLDLVSYVYREKRQGAHLVKERDGILTSAKHTIESSREWLEIQGQLRDAADSRAKSTSQTKGHVHVAAMDKEPEFPTDEMVRVAKAMGIEQFSHRAGISRAAYHLLKNGGGGRKVRNAVIRYLASSKNPKIV